MTIAKTLKTEQGYTHRVHRKKRRNYLSPKEKEARMIKQWKLEKIKKRELVD